MRYKRRDKNCKNNRGFAGKVGVPMRGGWGGRLCRVLIFCCAHSEDLAFCLPLIWHGRLWAFPSPWGFQGREPAGLSVSHNPLGEFDAAWDGGTQGWFRSVHYWPEEVNALLDHWPDHLDSLISQVYTVIHQHLPSRDPVIAMTEVLGSKHECILEGVHPWDVSPQSYYLRVKEVPIIPCAKMAWLCTTGCRVPWKGW